MHIEINMQETSIKNFALASTDVAAVTMLDFRFCQRTVDCAVRV